MQAIQRAIAEKDDVALARLLFVLRYNTPELVRLHDELTRLSATDEWLVGALRRRLNNIWFIVFKYTQERELVAAYEYDYLVRHSEPSSERSETRALMLEAVDRALQICYYGVYGVVVYRDVELYGAQLFRQMRPQDRVETLLVCRDEDALPFDDALLNPPRHRVKEWTVFHVRMRRLAFLLLRDVIGHFESLPTGQALRIVLSYADHLKTLIWRDTDDQVVPLEGVADQMRLLNDSPPLTRLIHQFFLPAAEWHDTVAQIALTSDYVLAGSGATDEWLLLIDRHWQTVQQEIPYANFLPFLHTFLAVGNDAECMLPQDGTYDFIYRDTAEYQALFFLRVATR